MKRYHSPTEDESKYLSSTRQIPREEWREFNKRMEQVSKEYEEKKKQSWKSAKNIKVKVCEYPLNKSANPNLNPKPLTINQFYSNENYSSTPNLTKYLRNSPKIPI